MKITRIKKDGQDYSNTELGMLIRQATNNSRFKFDMSYVYRNKLNLSKIRLKTNKEYCGSHPDSCEIDNGPSRKGNFLEGADWVEWNDMLNNILDANGIGANIKSSVCWVRKGTHRRIAYHSHMPNFGRNRQWNMDEPEYNYVCGFGKGLMISEFPKGTPGVYEAIGYNEVG